MCKMRRKIQARYVIDTSISEGWVRNNPFVVQILFKECLCGTLQFSSVAQSCLTLCDPMNRSTPGLSIHHQFPESIQTHVH